MFMRRQSSRTPSPPPPPPPPPPAPPSAAPIVMVAGGPPATRTLSRKGSSNDSFVCNVSDDEVIERDVDMEIEARIRSGTLPTSDRGTVLESAPLPAPVPQRPQRQDSVTSHAPSARRSSKSTLSQRMLSALQKNKNRSAATATRSKRSGSVLLEVVQKEQGVIPENNHELSYAMGADLDGLVVPDPLYDPSQDPVYMSDDDSPATIVANATSCKDRLEARLSERRLVNKSNLSRRHDSLSGAPVDNNEMSAVVYSNRRTYPAESARTVDPRFSENRDRLQDSHSRMPVDPRSAPGGYQYQYQHQYTANTVETLDASKSLPVAFHFQGNNNNNRSPQKPAAPVDYRNHRQVPEPRQDFGYQSQFRETAAPRRDNQYAALASSVNQIEQVVDGLESCLMSSGFSSLASVALRELELLRESTKQVRTNGTTLILAEVGRPQSQMLRPFRQIVSRAATLQSRIEMLIARIRSML